MILYPRLKNHPFFTENIYNWANIDDARILQEKPLYRSKYSLHVKEFYESKKSTIPKTMGYPQTPLKPPQDFLKKHSGEKKIESATKSVPCMCRDLRRCDRSCDRKQGTESPIILKHSKRDYLTENSILAQRRPASAPEPKLIDDRKGHSLELEKSGLVPKYINKEEYGEKPKYIEAIDAHLAASRRAFKEFLKAERDISVPDKMSEETKREIFEGLVKNWKELLRRYLMLPVQTDTIVQAKRKAEIEKRIDSLERDIELLIKNKEIFVGKDIPVRK